MLGERGANAHLAPLNNSYVQKLAWAVGLCNIALQPPQLNYIQ
jgi:hypothetical protein